MSRIKDLQKQVFKVLTDTDEPMKAMAHLHGVSLAAVMIAKKRRQNPELAAMSGLLHDLWAYKSGSYDDHAHHGADYARKVLGKIEIMIDKFGYEGERTDESEQDDSQSRRSDRNGDSVSVCCI